MPGELLEDPGDGINVRVPLNTPQIVEEFVFVCWSKHRDPTIRRMLYHSQELIKELKFENAYRVLNEVNTLFLSHRSLLSIPYLHSTTHFIL